MLLVLVVTWPQRARAEAESICKNQGLEVGRKGKVTKCLCNGLLYSPGEKNNPCLQRHKKMAKRSQTNIEIENTAPDVIEVINSTEEPVKSLRLETRPAKESENVTALTPSIDVRLAPEPIESLLPANVRLHSKPTKNIPVPPYCPPVIISAAPSVEKMIDNLDPVVSAVSTDAYKKVGVEIEAQLKTTPKDQCPEKTKDVENLVGLCHLYANTHKVANPDLTNFYGKTGKSCWYTVEYQKVNNANSMINLSDGKNTYAEGNLTFIKNQDVTENLLKDSYQVLLIKTENIRVNEVARWNLPAIRRMGDIFFVNLSPKVLLRCSTTDTIAGAGLLILD